MAAFINVDGKFINADFIVSVYADVCLDASGEPNTKTVIETVCGKWKGPGDGVSEIMQKIRIAQARREKE